MNKGPMTAFPLLVIAAALTAPATAAEPTIDIQNTNDNYTDTISTVAADIQYGGDSYTKGEGIARGEGTATSDGSATSDSNATSEGIGTSTSTSTATATSNGVTDSSVDNSTNSGSQLSIVADQELNVASTHNQLTITGSEPPGTQTLQTGAISLDGSALSGLAGVLNNSLNTAPQSNAQAATNMSVNASLGL